MIPTGTDQLLRDCRDALQFLLDETSGDVADRSSASELIQIINQKLRLGD